jgi:ribosomal protein S18 acetylase RimI-like enzyme
MLQAEVLAARDGHSAMALNVFTSNKHAQGLYNSLGYVVTNMNMTKPLVSK